MTRGSMNIDAWIDEHVAWIDEHVAWIHVDRWVLTWPCCPWGPIYPASGQYGRIWTIMAGYTIERTGQNHRPGTRQDLPHAGSQNVTISWNIPETLRF